MNLDEMEKRLDALEKKITHAEDVIAITKEINKYLSYFQGADCNGMRRVSGRTQEWAGVWWVPGRIWNFSTSVPPWRVCQGRLWSMNLWRKLLKLQKTGKLQK